MFCTYNALLGFQKLCGVNFSERQQCSIGQKLLIKKLQAKKLSQMDEKTVKKGYLYAPFSQKHFSESKSHSLIEAHGQKTSFAQKLVHISILLFSF